MTVDQSNLSRTLKINTVKIRINSTGGYNFGILQASNNISSDKVYLNTTNNSLVRGMESSISKSTSGISHAYYCNLTQDYPDAASALISQTGLYDLTYDIDIGSNRIVLCLNNTYYLEIQGSFSDHKLASVSRVQVWSTSSKTSLATYLNGTYDVSFGSISSNISGCVAPVIIGSAIPSNYRSLE